MPVTARALLLISLCVPACGSESESKNADAAVAAVDAGALGCSATEPGLVVFLNKRGGTFTSAGTGMDDSYLNVSRLTGEFPDNIAVLAPWSADNWSEIASCFIGAMRPFNVSVVETDPGDVDHVEVVFTASSYPGGGIYSVAPFECTPMSRPIAMVFGGAFGGTFSGDSQIVCESALQTFGSAAASLDHAYKCEDLMTYLPDCGEKTWVDEDVPCGESEARECSCGGETQNSYQQIVDQAGLCPAD